LSFSGPEFAALKAEIASAGRNVQPIKVRPPSGGKEKGCEFEVACGNRRHRACLELGLPIAAVVESLTDAELFAEMNREDREREDLTPWEQGVPVMRGTPDVTDRGSSGGPRHRACAGIQRPATNGGGAADRRS
jgi:ParB family chromosome partitioning protein